LTSIIIIAAVAALIGVRFFRPRAYQVQGFLFIAICILVGWLLALGSASNETAVADGQSNSEVLEVLAPEAARPPSDQPPDDTGRAAPAADPDNAPMSAFEDSSADMNADEAPEMNATNTN